MWHKLFIREGGTEWKVVCFVYQTFNFLASDPGNGAGCEALLLGLEKISVDRIIIYREREREREMVILPVSEKKS